MLGVGSHRGFAIITILYPFLSLLLWVPRVRPADFLISLTSDGQIYTTQISVTTVLTPGSVVTSTSVSTQDTSSSSSSNNTGVIVGAVVGGRLCSIFKSRVFSTVDL